MRRLDDGRLALRLPQARIFGAWFALRRFNVQKV
jgi:hypothetical protein